MEYGPGKRIEAARDYYRCYDTGDGAGIEALLSPDFTFDSPLDDHIDRAHYLARCWPMHEHIERFTLLDVCADDDAAIVRYDGLQKDGGRFSNIERLEFDGDQISHVAVYFATKWWE